MPRTSGPKSQRLTIYLLSQLVREPSDAIDPEKSPKEVKVDAAAGFRGSFFHEVSHVDRPAWVGFVEPSLVENLQGLSSASASGLLVIEAADRFFALTFGFGRSLLDYSIVVRQFGLRVALNTIDASQIRSLDTKTFDDMVVSRRTQTSRSSELPTFGVDISKDLLRAVTGKPRDKTFAKSISGSDSMVVNLPLLLPDVPAKLGSFLDAYGRTAYRENFEWIDHLTLVDDPHLVDGLNERLESQLRSLDFLSTHMAMPEPLDWQDLDGFKIGGAGRRDFDDLDLADYATELDDPGTELTVELLKQRRVSVRYARSGIVEARWSIYSCLVSEQTIDGELFALIESQWFRISASLVARVDDYVAAIPEGPIDLPPSFPGEHEDMYNRRAADASEGRLLCLDAKIRRPGGGSSGIEICDLLSVSGEFVHIKRKTRSSTLSHLFSQGSVSATTFVEDEVFRKKVRELVLEKSGGASDWAHLVPETPARRDSYSVSYAVIADSSAEGRSWLPFFSRLNLMQHARVVAGLGMSVSLTRVPVRS